jgi:hypothetical protein
VQSQFAVSGISVTALHTRLTALGCEKTLPAVRSWVLPEGVMAPRDRKDLELLNRALDLGLTDRRLSEIFAAVQRRRVFRRAAGRALAEAARTATVANAVSTVDPDTGLSIADLREAVIEAEVIAVAPCSGVVPLAELGHLEEGQ